MKFDIFSNNKTNIYKLAEAIESTAYDTDKGNVLQLLIRKLFERAFTYHSIITYGP